MDVMTSDMRAEPLPTATEVSLASITDSLKRIADVLTTPNGVSFVAPYSQQWHDITKLAHQAGIMFREGMKNG